VSDPSTGSPDPALTAAIAAVAHGADPDAVLAELLNQAMTAGGGTRAAAFLWDAEREALAVAATVGAATGMEATFEAAAAEPDNLVARAAHERVIVRDVPMPFPSGPMVVAAWPVVIGRDGVDEPIGAIALGGPAPWTADDATSARIASVADLVAIAVDRAQSASMLSERSEWLERIAHADALTGLANARTLGRVLELEVARAARQGSEISVAILDVDGFQATNEASGRAAGDDVLREVAAVLAEQIRLVDTVGRWGGDEFALVAPGSAGTVVARRIQEALARLPEIHGRRVSVSAGIARFPADGTTGEELIEVAEAALAAAKRAGHGQIGEPATAG
jgi:diguanylate cyclase (GGDEF)-like protein